MPEPTDQIHHQLTPAERKQALIVACHADRAAWQKACAPLPHLPLQAMRRVLKFIEPFTSLLPGRLGRWLNHASFFVRLVSAFEKF
jgi:hypothetical protein